MRILLIGLSLVSVAAATATAQPASDPRFAVTVNGGVGMGENRTGGALGASVGVALSSRVAGEFETVFADRGPGVTALSFEGRMQISLMPPGARLVPQVVVGAGAYRSQFDFDNRQMFGAYGQMSPQQFGAAMGMPGAVPFAGTTWRAGQAGSGYHGSMWTVVNQSGVTVPVNMPQIPMFYAQRMGTMGFGYNGQGSRTFTDPALVFGGGLTYNATEHLFIRPEARALMVIAQGDTYTVGFVTARVGVRF